MLTPSQRGGRLSVSAFRFLCLALTLKHSLLLPGGENIDAHCKHFVYGFKAGKSAMLPRILSIPSMVIVCLFVYRTRREDRMLQEGLAGYAAYAQDVH